MKKYSIICLHGEDCREEFSQTLSKECTLHCNKFWNTRTYEQALVIKAIHEDDNPGHRVEIRSVL